MARANFGVEYIEKYGEIVYVDLPRGYVRITNDFANKFLVKYDLPLIGPKYLHREMITPLVDSLTSIQENIHDNPFAQWDYIENLGIYCPRHMWHKKNKPLSMHAWGLALDIKSWENMPGTRGKIPMEIVEVFEDHGFEWGGRWRYRDDMHFELAIGRTQKTYF